MSNRSWLKLRACLQILYLLWMLALPVLSQSQPVKSSAATSGLQTTRRIKFGSKSIGDLYICKFSPDLKWFSSRLDAKGTRPARGEIVIDLPQDAELGCELNPRAFSQPELLDEVSPPLIVAFDIHANIIGQDDAGRIAGVLRRLGRFKELRALDIGKSDISDALLAQMPILNKLEAFSSFSDFDLKGECLRHFAKFPNLRFVCLWMTGFKGENLVFLKDLKKLEHLDLAQTSLRGTLQLLPPIPTLKWLDVSSNEIGDDDLKYLARLKNLETLAISRTKITDKGLPALVALKNLKVLDVYATGVTADGLLALVKQLHLRQLVFTEQHQGNDAKRLRAFCPNVYSSGPARSRKPAKELQDLQHIFSPISKNRGL